MYDDDFIELLPKLTLHSGNPFFINPHAVPFFKVSELVESDGVKAVLSGEGADELFLGYPWLVPGRTRRRQPRLAASPSTVLASPVTNGATTRKPWLRRRGRHERTVPFDLITGLLNGFEVELESEQNRRRIATLTDGVTRLQVTESLDLLNYNLRGLLHRNDAMGMAAGIESRFPFLDTDLARTAVNLPAALKGRRDFNPRDRRHPLFIDKWVLRRIAGRYLPKELQNRPKYPFSTNAFQRMRIGGGLFQGGFVAETFRLTNDEIERTMLGSDQRLRVKLLHLEVWGQMFARGNAPDALVESLRNHVTFGDRGSHLGGSVAFVCRGHVAWLLLYPLPSQSHPDRPSQRHQLATRTSARPPTHIRNTRGWASTSARALARWGLEFRLPRMPRQCCR